MFRLDMLDHRTRRLVRLAVLLDRNMRAREYSPKSFALQYARHQRLVRAFYDLAYAGYFRRRA